MCCYLEIHLRFTLSFWADSGIVGSYPANHVARSKKARKENSGRHDRFSEESREEKGALRTNGELQMETP